MARGVCFRFNNPDSREIIIIPFGRFEGNVQPRPFFYPPAPRKFPSFLFLGEIGKAGQDSVYSPTELLRMKFLILINFKVPAPSSTSDLPTPTRSLGVPPREFICCQLIHNSRRILSPGVGEIVSQTC